MAEGEAATAEGLGFQEDATAAPTEAAAPAPAEAAAPEEPAVAAEAAEATPAVAEAAVLAEKTIYLAGRAFTNRAQLQEHVKKIQESMKDADETKGDLNVEDNLFIFHLLLHHPKAVEKMTKPISHFRYGTYDKFKNKCFISVAADGSQEGVSAAKSIEVIYPKTPNGDTAISGLVATPPVQEEKKGQKRSRDEKPPEPRVFKPEEMVRGCVVDVKGLPANVHYHRLKELLNGCGKVRFLQLLNVKKPSKEPPQKKAKTEEEKETEEDAEEKEEEEEEEEEECPVTARCRFTDPEGATGAMGALQGAEVQGTTVELVLLEGKEEEEYWEETNRRLKEAFDNPKGKGKKGKDKGKDKGKGKGKGKKGKSKDKGEE